MTDAELQAHLVELELALMTDGNRAEALLHAQAEEVGRSGRRYDRAALAHLLAERPQRIAADIGAVTLQRLADDLALLRYRSQRDGATTERSSLWQRQPLGWQLRFHQGTPA